VQSELVVSPLAAQELTVHSAPFRVGVAENPQSPRRILVPPFLISPLEKSPPGCPRTFKDQKGLCLSSFLSSRPLVTTLTMLNTRPRRMMIERRATRKSDFCLFLPFFNQSSSEKISLTFVLPYIYRAVSLCRSGIHFSPTFNVYLIYSCFLRALFLFFKISFRSPTSLLSPLHLILVPFLHLRPGFVSPLPTSY